jgi:hypothetical protein
MARKIYLIGGGKGGVGKSMVTMAMLERLREAGTKLMLVETDTSNPDVYKCYGEEISSELCDLETANGWVNLLNLCDQHADCTVVINTRAANNQGIGTYGETLRDALGELGRDLVTLWVINAQRDSVELLKAFMEIMGESTAVHVVRNTYFGPEEEFQVFNGSKTRAAIEARGGRSLTFPVLGSRVANDLYTKRLSIGRAMRELPIGDRAELRRWKGVVDRALEQVTGAA